MQNDEQDFSFKSLFVPFTTGKAILLIVTVGLIVYFNSLFNGFVGDDLFQLVNNPLIHSFFNIPKIFSGSTFYLSAYSKLQGVNYRPLMPTFYTLVYSVFGEHAFFFHLFQILIHTTNAVLLYLIFKKYFSNGLSFISALVFLIHPINSEAVVLIANIQDILFLFFGLMALYLVQSKSQSAPNKIILFFLLMASAFSKETGIVFLFIIPLFVLIYKIRGLLYYTLISASVFVVYLFFRIPAVGIYNVKTGIAPIVTAPLRERLMTIPGIVTYYIKTFIYPYRLAISQQWIVRRIDFAGFYLPLLITFLLILTLIIYGIVLWRNKESRFRQYLFFLIWFVLGLGLHLNIIPLDQTVADRWFYFPIIGLIGLLAVISSGIKLKNQLQLNYVIILITIVISALSLRTIIRNFNWHDNMTLYSHDEKINTTSYDLENALAIELGEAGKIDQAEIHFKKSIELVPNWWLTWNNLGIAYRAKSDYKNAEMAFQKAIDISIYPAVYTPYSGMANLLLYSENNYVKAAALLDKAVKDFPTSTEFWKMKALSEYKLGNQEKALNAAQTLVKLNPSNENNTIYAYIKQLKPIDILK